MDQQLNEVQELLVKSLMRGMIKLCTSGPEEKRINLSPEFITDYAKAHYSNKSLIQL